MGASSEQHPAKDEVRQQNVSQVSKSAAKTGAGTRSDLRKSVRQMGYEEGSKALSTNKEQKTEEREAARHTYEEALGEVLGGKLYDVILKETDPQKMMEHADKAVESLVRSVASQVKEGRDLDSIGPEAAASQMEALQEILKKEVEEYMSSEDGQRLGDKISGYVRTHPWEVVGAVLLAAAAAVAANVKLPELKAKLKLAEGLDAEIKARLGKIREITLETISARLQYMQGRFKGEIVLEHSKESGTTGTLGAKYGDDRNNVSTTATVDSKGLLKAKVGAIGTRGRTQGSASVEHTREEGTSADANVSFGDKSDRVSGGAHYQARTGDLTLKLSRELQQGLYTGSRGVEYRNGQLGGVTSDRYGTDRNFVDIKTSGNDDNSKVGVLAGYGTGAFDLKAGVTRDSKDGTTSTLGARYSARDLKVALDASFAPQRDTVSGSIDANLSSGLVYGADATFSLTDNRLLGYGTKFGFRDPDQFRGFLMEYRRNEVPEIPEDKFKLTLETTVNQLMLRAGNETTLRDGRLSMGRLGIHGAYPINKDWSVIAGVNQGYGPDREIGTMPEIGVQIKKIPVLVGYDANSKAWSVRLTIPFGR